MIRRFDPTSDSVEGRIRLRSPREITPGTYRRVSSWGGRAAPGVSFIVGTLRETGEEALQGLRFDRGIWEEGEAVAWAEDGRYAATWGASDWEKITFAAARVFADAEVRFADDGYDDSAEVDTAFTPTNVLNWIEKTADDRVDSVVGGYLKRYRKTALGNFARGAGVADLKRGMQAQSVDLPEKIAKREARTMTTAVYNYSKMERYARDKAVSEFLYVAILDTVTSDICRALAGKRFTKEEAADYLPPLHYNCRSTIRAITVFDDKADVEKYQSVEDARAEDPEKFEEAVDNNLEADFRNPEGFVKFTEESWKNPKEIKLKPTNAKLLGVALNAISDDLIEKADDAALPPETAEAIRDRGKLWKDRTKGIAKAGNMADSFAELFDLAKGVRKSSDTMFVPGSPEAVTLADYVDNLAATWETFYTGGKTKRPKKARAERLDTPVEAVEAAPIPISVEPPPTKAKEIPRAKRYRLMGDVLDAISAPARDNADQGASVFGNRARARSAIRGVKEGLHSLMVDTLARDISVEEMRKTLGDPAAVWAAITWRSQTLGALTRVDPTFEAQIRTIIDPVVAKFGADIDAAATAPREISTLRRGKDVRAAVEGIPKKIEDDIKALQVEEDALVAADAERIAEYNTAIGPHRKARWAIDDELDPLNRDIALKSLAGEAIPPEMEARALALANRRDEIAMKELEVTKPFEERRNAIYSNFESINKRRAAIRNSQRAEILDALAIEDPAARTTVKMNIPARNRNLDPEKFKEAAEFLSRIVGLKPGETLDVPVLPTGQSRSFHYGLAGAAEDNSSRKRAYLRGTSGKININPQDRRVSVIAHETGHLLEDRFEGVTVDIRNFYERRTAGENTKKLGAGYGKDEITRKDKFIDKYTGKEYGPSARASEVLSMGIQHLFEDPLGFAQKDPDHFEFIIDVLRGHDL